MKKVEKKVSEKQLAKEREKAEILSKANQAKGETLALNESGEIIKVKDLKKFAFGGVENPEKKYEVYYKGLQRLLKKHLPQGQKYEKARGYVYEEKNTFLTRGYRKNKEGIRGQDSRMGHLVEAETILNVVVKWIRNSGTAVDLYNVLRDMNIKRGYGTAEYPNRTISSK